MTTRWGLTRRWVRLLPLLCAVGTTVATGVSAEDGPSAAQPAAENVEVTRDAPAAPDAPAEKESLSLSTRQDAVALRYQRFEATLLQLAEYLRRTDPDRAELLFRALGKSKESRLPDQFSELVRMLDRGQLGDAIDNQEAVTQQLKLILALLQSEDRQSDLAAEQARIQALIRDVDKLISRQVDARSLTERGAPAEEASRGQKKVVEQTQEVLKQIDEHDGRSEDASEKDSEGTGDPSKDPQKPTGGESPKDADRPKDRPEQSGDEPETPPSGEKPSDDSPNPSDLGKSGEKPSPGGPSQRPSKPSEGAPKGGDSPMEPGDSSQQDPGQQESGQQDPGQQDAGRPRDETPGRKELSQAREAMEKAIRELEQKKADAASDRQDEALSELQKAKEQLEEILRQLREEEQELVLAALEARFREMLARQVNIYNGTVGLAAIPAAERTDRQRTRAIELARLQDEVALMAAKALTLLKEEGSSVAFPEAVIQLRQDMQTSSRRLERVEVDELTQGIQKDIVEALEEILDSLQKELEKAKDRQQPQGQQAQQQSQEPALVDGLSELKMLRSLQYRINRRTKQLGRLVEGEQARDPDVLQQLRQLSARQAKLQQTTYDLATGRNQ